jgi:prepilin-type N-terminal cleavage/methylation domain-containing protein
MPMNPFRNQRGFTMIELLVATVTMTVMLGAAVALTSQIQNGYRRQLEDSAAEQEGRYALDWIGRYIRSADNNPQAKATTNCPANNTAVRGVIFDPDNDDIDDDVRIMTDANPPDGLFGGTGVGQCTQSNEDVTISHDAANNTVVFRDNNTNAAITTRTDTVIENLRFIFRNSARQQLDTTVVGNQANVVWVETRIVLRSRTINATTGQPTRRTISSEVRVRSRP